ncbi:hypothetical protein C8Q75DRAFT_711370, partial [Abortiporus biennis]
RIFLLWFTIYTLSVCPTDEHLKSPICRGLSEYRRLVLEPYILPVFHRVLENPSVAPYVDKATPYVNGFIDTTTPIVLRTQAEWNIRVVPQWNKRVVPQWNKHVVPQWQKHAVPYIELLENKLEPYRVQLVKEYNTRVVPHARVAIYNLQKWQYQAQPYVILAAQKTYGGYQQAKPYAIPVWNRFKAFLAELARILEIQRRQYVDPHVKRIWERVLELSGVAPRSVGDSRPTPTQRLFSTRITQPVSSVFTAVSSSAFADEETDPTVDSALPTSPTSEPSPDIPEPASTELEPSPSATPFASDASETLEETASSIVSELSTSASSVPSFVSSLADIPPAHVDESIIPTLSSVANVIEESASSVISHVTSVVDDEASEIVLTASSLTDQSSSEPVAVPTVSSSSSVDSDEDDLDLNAFYADLGLGEEDLLSPDFGVTKEEAPPPVPTESEEEKAERLRLRKIETAKKRADITGRHSKWEDELEAKAVENEQALRKALVTLRKAAVSELKASVEIRKEIEALVHDAEKFLKGADKYFSNLKGESRRDEDRRIMWQRVVDKVDAKFNERLEQTETLVNGWYNGILNRELAEIRKFTDEVRDIADRGQADIGLDYAWLDDVTYYDWQRYHDLMTRSDNFTALAFTIQNGTHPSAPSNPVLPALEDLQAEVQDVVVGFETRLRRIKRNGERSFGGSQDSKAEDINSDETVSILPIEDEKHKGPEEGESRADIPPVVIGKSKQEVMDALNRVAEAEGQSTSNTDSTPDPEKMVVETLAHEVEEQQHSSSLHVEL